MDGSALGMALGVALAALGMLLGALDARALGMELGGALNVQFRVGVQARHVGGVCPLFGMPRIMAHSFRLVAPS